MRIYIVYDCSAESDYGIKFVCIHKETADAILNGLPNLNFKIIEKDIIDPARD